LDKGTLKAFLDEQAARYNTVAFVDNDPISIPHGFQKLQDVEIMAFWTAMLAWGQRKSIINSGRRLAELMDGAPHDFVLHHSEQDRARFMDFKHRTFQPIDAFYFLEFLQWHYQRHTSLEAAFVRFVRPEDAHVGHALLGFHELFFSLPDAPRRTRKHIATPANKATCKRLNMFLRWMVRTDECGVDFGLWKGIKPAQLLVPLDVHVDRVARRLGLLQRQQTDWQSVLELTAALRQLDADDPVKYDFALFGIGCMGPRF
jgi:uncharacterized protein (TIGR02757 family)